MIDPKELRIGNWIYSDKTTTAGQVFSVSPHTVENEANFGSFYKNVYPILLTPEILEQCGFKRVGNDDDYIVWRIWFEAGYYEELCTSGTPEELYYYGNSGPIGMPLKTLHQLQNIHYFLTGSELEFKSEPIQPHDSATTFL